ncbi:Nuclear distribution protein nudE-like 1-B [Liparis tanakae]|uniref:Nuclear distribution protein nudE-like 1-B n=1 Tax=Liparis tanakae TaxID=230148 RepID=A0A4Z2FI33_9TELE|nr:Nuclear distribution protein nudE-like 1-B [Liparis tanakae]
MVAGFSSSSSSVVFPKERVRLPCDAMNGNLFAMETDMTPKFSSKDEEIDFWKTLSLKYKERPSECFICRFVFVSLALRSHSFQLGASPSLHVPERRLVYRVYTMMSLNI